MAGDVTNSCCERITAQDLDEVLGNHLGERFRLYRRAWHAAGRDNVPAFPVHLDLELIDFCNQRCSFCPRNSDTHPDLPYPLNTRQELDAARLERIYDEAGRNGLYSINIAFGEPLIYKGVFEVVRRFHQAGVVDSRLVTNGLLLNRFIDEVFASGLVNLYVSIDAFSAETYGKLRGKGYERVVENMNLLLDEKRKRGSLLPITRVSFVETETNRHELAAFRTYWENRVDLLDIQFFQDFNNFKTGKGSKKWRCIDPFRRVSITADGNILPCCTFYGKMLPIGNIGRDTIRSAWASERMAKVRRDLMNESSRICRACQEC